MIVLNKFAKTLGASPKFPPFNRSVLLRRMRNGGDVMIVLPSRSSGILHSGGARSAAELLRNSAACASHNGGARSRRYGLRRRTVPLRGTGAARPVREAPATPLSCGRHIRSRKP